MAATYLAADVFAEVTPHIFHFFIFAGIGRLLVKSNVELWGCHILNIK